MTMQAQDENCTMPARKPNLFILGAAKSGTTTLWSSLRQHPDIFLSRPKEPAFFCETFQKVQNPIHYFELFDRAGTASLVGEASHAYLSDPKATASHPCALSRREVRRRTPESGRPSPLALLPYASQGA